MQRAGGVRRVIWGIALLAGVFACTAGVWAQSCEPELPFERLSSPQATRECLQALMDGAADPVGAVYWRTLAAAEEAVQARDAGAIGVARDALALLAKEHATTLYGARALVSAAGLTNDQQGLPLVAIPMYRQARKLFAAYPQWPYLNEHLAGIDLGLGDAYMSLQAHGQAGKMWEEALQRYPATRAAQRLPARLRHVYERSLSPAEASSKTLAVYDAVLGQVAEAEARRPLALERLDVVEQAVRTGLAPGERLAEEAKALLQAFPEGMSAHMDVSRLRVQVLAGETPEESVTETAGD